MVEGMRTSLEEATTNMQTFLDSVTIAVSMNADSVLEKYQSTELYLDTALTNPWVAAKKAVGEYGDNANNLMDVWAKDGYFAKFSSEAGKNLKSPFNAGKTAAEQFGQTVNTSMGNMYTSVKSNVESSITQLNRLKAKYDELNDSTIRPPSTGSGNDGGGGQFLVPTTEVYQLQQMLNGLFSAQVGILDVNGIYDSATKSAISRIQANLGITPTGLYDEKTKKAMQAWLNKQNVGSWFRKVGFGIPDAMYAKGTTGTKRNELAVVDELGPELILHANPQTGRLEYLTKGSGVVPADLTANLMEWGQFTPDSMSFGSGVNVNMINNAVVKPQYDFNFDSLVHVDHCDQNTIKDLEKMIDNKINDFSKALNYSVKRFAR